MKSILNFTILLLCTVANLGFAQTTEHYFSFPRHERFLELYDSGDEGLLAALETPGVKGIWVHFDWNYLETSQNVYQWTNVDRVRDIADDNNLKFIINVADRSFNGEHIVPGYLQANYEFKVDGRDSDPNLVGYVAKKWDNTVITRLAKLYNAIGERYESNPNFAGITTGETAVGKFKENAMQPNGNDPQYDKDAYKAALIKLITDTKDTFSSPDQASESRIFFYMNYIKDGNRNKLTKDNGDPNDYKVRILDDIAQMQNAPVVIGAPDVMGDASGQVNTVIPFYVHARQNYPSVEKFCHAQFNDHKQLKNNKHRKARFDDPKTPPPTDTLRTPNGIVASAEPHLHRNEFEEKFWTPFETYRYGKENIGCKYFFWHYIDDDNDSNAKDGPKDPNNNNIRTGRDDYQSKEVLPLIESNFTCGPADPTVDPIIDLGAFPPGAPNPATSGDDIIIGTYGDDTIEGLDGNDVICGGAGNDTINGGLGNDRISGQSGMDELRGDEGDDRIFGQSGNDKIFGGSGNDTVFAGDGDDLVDGGSGDDKLYGSNGIDNLKGQGGVDELYGGNGDDILRGGSGDDRLFGGAGVDDLGGAAGADRLFGQAGEDKLVGGNDGNNDVLNGGGDDDRCVIWSGDTAPGCETVVEY